MKAVVFDFDGTLTEKKAIFGKEYGKNQDIVLMKILTI